MAQKRTQATEDHGTPKRARNADDTHEYSVYVMERQLLKKVFTFLSSFGVDKCNLLVLPDDGISVRLMDSGHTSLGYVRLFEKGFLAAHWNMATPAKFTIGCRIKSWLSILGSSIAGMCPYVRLRLPADDGQKTELDLMQCKVANGKVDQYLREQRLQQVEPYDEDIWKQITGWTITNTALEGPVPDLEQDNPALRVIMSSRTLAGVIDASFRTNGVKMEFCYPGSVHVDGLDDLRRRLRRTAGAVGLDGSNPNTPATPGMAGGVYQTDEFFIRKVLAEEACKHDLDLTRAVQSVQTDAAESEAAWQREEDQPVQFQTVQVQTGHVAHVESRSGAIHSDAKRVAALQPQAVQPNQRIAVDPNGVVLLHEDPAILEDSARSMHFGPKLIHDAIKAGKPLSDTVTLSFYPAKTHSDAELVVMGFEMGEQACAIIALASVMEATDGA